MTEAQFEKLYKRYRTGWLALARKLTKDSTVAEDVVSEVMLIIARDGLSKLQAKENPESWIRQRIIWYVKNYIWLNSWYTEGRIEQHSVSLTALEENDHPVMTAKEATEPETTTPLESALREALSKLDIQQQDIVCMFVFAKMKFREIAEVLGLTLRQVAYLYQEVALPKLRFSLENVGAVPPEWLRAS